MHINRFLPTNIPKGKSCFLWGARQTGKTTYLKERFPEALFINLLRADVYQSYHLSPNRLREELHAMPSKERLVIIDEVQKIPLLLDEVHGLIEEGYQFILCGSSARRLKQSGSNLLGGRAWRYNFVPLSYVEIGTLNWEKIFNHGLIPSNYLADEYERNLAAYLYDYLLPEVQYEAQIRKRENFARFLDVLGICHGEMISYSNIARDCGVSGKTVQSYFEILEDMYLGYSIYPYQKKIKRQIVQEKPRFYLFDTGLANYLKKYKWNSMRGIEAGRTFEHYTLLELMAYKLLTDKRDKITYWRTKEGDEVDFLIQNQAIEVKMNDSIDKRHIKGLLTFSKYHNFSLNIICLETKIRKMKVDDKEVTVWPIEDFLKSLWAGNFWK